MASVLLRSMMASIAGPLLHLSRAALKPRSLSTSLLDALRGAHPPGTEVRWLPWGRAQRSLLQLDPLLSSPQPAQGFKTKGVLKKRCRDCYLVKRRGRWFVYCKTHPRHKQRLM